MAPKRQKTSKASSSQSFDKHYFVSEATFHRYKASLLSRPLLPERGFDIQHTRYDNITAIIDRRQWQTFAQQPEAAVVPVVREFYANAYEHKDCTVFVRGCKVSFHRSVINRFYNLPDIENDDYSQYIAHEVNYNDIIQTLCRPGAQWTLKNGEIRTFRLSDLDRNLKAWHSFLCAKLLPVSHVSSVTRDRASLLYAIFTHKSIDIGHVIQNSILHSLKGSTTGGFGHPSLITALCRDAGVTWQPTEELLLPTSALNQPTIDKLSSWTAVDYQPPALRAGANTSTSNAARLSSLEAEVKEQRQFMQQFVSYQTNFNNTLAQFCSQFTLSPG